MDWSSLKTDLEAALDGFDGETDWTGKIVDHQLLTVPDLSNCEKLGEVHAAFMTENAFACFDDENMHFAANQGRRFPRDAVFAWLVRRSLGADVSTAVDNLRNYIENSSITAYQIVFVDGLYCESSDDEAGFSEDFRICHLMHAPVQILRSQAFRQGLLIEGNDYIVYKEIKIKRQITKASEERGAQLLKPLPSLEPIEDRISLLSLVAKRGFQIASSSIIVGDDVPLSNTASFVSAGHSRRAPVPMGPGVIALQTRHAEDLLQKFSSLKTKTQNRLRVPLRKLNDYLSTNDQVQRMVDLRTCLEALFLAGFDEKNELTFRLALHASFYTEITAQKRRDVFKAVRHCYRLGSKAVHEGTVEITPEDNISVQITLNAVRSALFKQINGDIVTVWSGCSGADWTIPVTLLWQRNAR
ncbi:MAG: HEPN domain-containing protein, partial [Paracoccaceae bacterium]|nr:HEPN domain-containing protein [Paracoccaceae bacterium]